jgi:predicted CxxxxCH...CXXCH cytochrome family protein
VCHGGTYSRTTVDATLHLNFSVDVRGGGNDCSGCHAGPADAQFRDLLGQTDPARQTVGAHQAHLNGGRFRGGLQCADCHTVPTSVRAPGHIDTAGPAEVVTNGGLAFSFGASPVYTPANATCSGVYCHGAGSRAQRDTAPNKMTSPVWTGGAAQVVCGSCHGLPPQDGTAAHTGRTLADCAGCHGQSVSADGGIRFTVDGAGKRTSTHLDGVISGN